MKTINDEIAGVLADPDFDDDQKVEVVQMLVDSEQNKHICTPEENLAILKDLAAKAGIDWDAPLEPKAVLTAVDICAIEKAVASQMKAVPPLVDRLPLPATPASKLSFCRIEAAASLSISPRTLDDLTKRGLLRPSRAIGRPLYALSELQRFLDETRLE